jgi:chromosome segregation ATPase
MKDLDARADDAADQASELQANLLTSNSSWEVHAQKLQALKDDVNEMGRLLARLEEVRGTLGAEDREVLDRAAVVLKEMAANTTAAVQYLNVDQQNFWIPSYRKSVNNLVNESSQLSSSLNRVIALDKTRAREKHLEKSLEQ